MISLLQSEVDQFINPQARVSFSTLPNVTQRQIAARILARRGDPISLQWLQLMELGNPNAIVFSVVQR